MGKIYNEYSENQIVYSIQNDFFRIKYKYSFELEEEILRMSNYVLQ